MSHKFLGIQRLKPFKVYFWYYFLIRILVIQLFNFYIMSQNLRKAGNGAGGIIRIVTESESRKNYEGFEGMNFEQIRQPYNPKLKNRKNTTGERNDEKGPDEG